jgi:hypothetical protein
MENIMTDINFNEAEHKYYDDNKKIYTSVTTLIGKYTEQFDTDFWSMFTALKNNHYKVKPEPEKQSIYVAGSLFHLSDLKRTPLFAAWQEEVKAKWKSTTIEACERGNIIHNAIESGINESKQDMSALSNQHISPIGNRVIKTIHDLDSTNLKRDFLPVYTRLSAYIDKGFSVFAEKRVFLSKYLIAGMIDAPLFIGKRFCILDWKSNKDTIHERAGYYKKEKINNVWVKSDTFILTGKCFNYPLNNLEASKFNTYALQLSLYAFILEQWGYELIEGGLEIIHFPVGNPPRLLKMPYLKNEIQLLLNHHETSILK